MDPHFALLVEALAPKLEELLAMQPLRYGILPTTMSKSGVYLFTESGKHLYIGRSNRLRARYFLHCRPGSQHNQATFAFQLAREITGRTTVAYRAGEGSRAGLMRGDAFATAFSDAKGRIREMQYRYVEEADQTRQSLLEIYAATVLGTKYNDFGTH
jgi:hypothetical protein